MTCASCVTKIERHLKGIPGIVAAEIALLTHRGRVRYNASLIGPRDIINRITVRILDHRQVTRSFSLDFGFSCDVTYR
jgi:copper chaperone CopZ